MTNKEAIEVLKGIYPNGAYSPTEELRHEAINMAISALTTTPEEPASEDLYEAFCNYVEPLDNHPTDQEEELYMFDAFKAGAQWQKRHVLEALRTEYEKGRYDMREDMMKEAVESEIENTFSLRKITHYSTNNGDLQYYGRISLEGNYKRGDKVKLIIVKED